MKIKAYFYIVTAAVLWGIISIFMSALSKMGLNSIGTAAVRFIISALLMSAYYVLKDRTKFRIKIKDFWLFLGTGIAGLLFFSLCYFVTINNIGVAFAVVFLYTAPIFVSIISAIAFKEAMGKTKIISVIITFIGCIFVSEMLSANEKIGLTSLLVALGAGFGYGLYTIFCKALILRNYESETITLYTFIVSSVGILPLLPYGNLECIMNPQGILWAVLLALFSAVVPYLLYSKGLELVDASVASVLSTIELVVGAVVGFVVFKEQLSISKIIGILLILVAVNLGYFVIRKGKDKINL